MDQLNFAGRGNQKAGMGGDKALQAKIIFEASKNSAYFLNKKEKDQATDLRVEQYKEKLAKMDWQEREEYESLASNIYLDLELSRKNQKVCCVIDMDMFYAAVEMRDDPSLVEVPLAVGGQHGVIATANYAARQYGVRAAMPGFIAQKLAKELKFDLKFVHPRFDVYMKDSATIEALVGAYDPSFKGAASPDEFYLDLTLEAKKRAKKMLLNAQRQKGPTQAGRGIDKEKSKEKDKDKDWGKARVHLPKDENARWALLAAMGGEILLEIRHCIFDATGLTASGGIANHFRLAKLCADLNKPNGQFICPFDLPGMLQTIDPLPLNKVGGIGPVSGKVLEKTLGITTVGQIKAQSGKIVALFSEKFASFLLGVSVGVGRDNSIAGCDEADEGDDIEAAAAGRKSISSSETFRKTTSLEFFLEKIQSFARDLSGSLLKKGCDCAHISLKMKRSDFKEIQRSKALLHRTNDPGVLFDAGQSLLLPLLQEQRQELGSDAEARLLGLCVSKLSSASPSSPSSSSSSVFATQGDSKRQKTA